jgi:hypothetical protein
MIHASGWGGGSDPLWQRTNQSEQLLNMMNPPLLSMAEDAGVSV